MNPTVKQIKDWRSSQNLTRAQCAEILGVSNFARYVTTEHAQALPAPNWFRGCAYSALPFEQWSELARLAAKTDFAELYGQSPGVRFLGVAYLMLYTSDLRSIREEMGK